MSQLLNDVRETIRRKHLSYKTEDAYVGWIVKYVKFYKCQRHPNTMGRDEIECYLTHLAINKKVAPSTQNQAYSALMFLYKNVLKIEIEDVDAMRAKQNAWMPTVLSVPETRRLLSHMSGTYAIIGGLLYGGGLRLMEALRLRVKDIDFDRKQITLRDTKSNRDRVVPLPETITEPLRLHLAVIKAQWEIDLAAGHGDVELPNALDRKYPNAPTEWGWQYVFRAEKLSKDPRSGAVRKHHLYETGVQKAVAKAAKLAGIDKPVGPHTLRHSYATHLAERGEPIEVIQKLLGHKDIRTTMVYLHLADRKPRSPLDDL
jgi:integron integrase